MLWNQVLRSWQSKGFAFRHPAIQSRNSYYSHKSYSTAWVTRHLLVFCSVFSKNTRDDDQVCVKSSFDSSAIDIYIWRPMCVYVFLNNLFQVEAYVHMLIMLQIQLLPPGQGNILTLQPRFKSRKATDQSGPERSLRRCHAWGLEQQRARVRVNSSKTSPGAALACWIHRAKIVPGFSCKSCF